MSSAGGSHSGSEDGEVSQDFELNIASIVDCFTVLITYMLAAASFITVGAVGAGLVTAGDGNAPAVLPGKAVSIVLEMKADQSLQVRTSGAEDQVYKFPPQQSGAWDFQAAVGAIKAIRTRFPASDSLTLLPEERTSYRDIIGLVHQAKKELPVFFIKTETLWAEGR